MDTLQLKITIGGIIVSCISGGLAGTIIGHFFTIRRERDGRRIAFRNTIAVLLADLNDTEDERAFHSSSRRSVLVECAKIGNDISCCRLERFKTARAAYCDVYQQDADLGMQRHGQRLQEMFDTATKHPEIGRAHV